MIRLFRHDSLPDAEMLRRSAADLAGTADVTVESEWCVYVDVEGELEQHELELLRWLLAETFEPDGLRDESHLDSAASVLEVGPRLTFETAWSSTAVAICHVNGLVKVRRLERSRRYGLSVPVDAEQASLLLAPLHDRMTETRYVEPLETFDSGEQPAAIRVVPLIEEGLDALRRVNTEQGLAMDEQDLDRFYDLFVNQLERNPTDVELFQLGVGNSEHSRHGFFRGRLVIDGNEIDTTLMKIVKKPWQARPGNSLIAFKDDSSAIRGGPRKVFVPAVDGRRPGPMQLDERVYHPTLTAETHNFPSGVAPYPGAATGTGGRIRDNQAVGRGGLVAAGGAAYCVGNLGLPNLEWEQDDDHLPPSNLASPLDILIEASNGASDYGNCFGEPVIYGFARTFGMQTAEGYRAWFKPIMYAVGAGQVDDLHVEKGEPRSGMLVVQIGGPAYRIGMGGGSASSLLAGENVADLDFDAVQRGNPEMEQRVDRVMRACIEMGGANPIVTAHDLGAGGDSNALPEIAHPAGARIDLASLPLGDPTLSALEIWGNESQERNVVLVEPRNMAVVEAVCAREKAPVAVVGEITGDGRLVLHDSRDGETAVDLPLEPILGDVPPKEIRLESQQVELRPFTIPDGTTVASALARVLRLPAVASKAYLTRKVDRSVTGKIAQQQCVGPNHLPLSDFAVIGQSLFGVEGVALSLGEQPLKGLVDPASMARMSVAEAVLNMAGARITSLQDIKCEANWMWAAKLPGEGERLYRAAVAMCDLMMELGIAVDGGKDSLSMATLDPSGETVKAPGELVIAAYAPMPDVGVKVTPDVKREGNALVLIDLSDGMSRLGGSALGQVYGQAGDEVPDVADAAKLAAAFSAVQDLVSSGAVVSAHDRSDGGLVVTLCEMAFGGNAGIDVRLQDAADPFAALFCEELGLVVETADADATLSMLQARGVDAALIGLVGPAGGRVVIRHNDSVVIDRPMTELRAAWEETSTELDRRQADVDCVNEESNAVRDLVEDPAWQLSFTPVATPAERLQAEGKPRVAILREQGTNGDRELASSFFAAGLEVWDVTMSDLIDGRARLDDFQGVAFPGGFSYGDVLDSGKGWASVIRFNEKVRTQFDAFYERPDTFSLGVCNGCQLMALLGWVPWKGLADEIQPRFIRNRSRRFESRFVTVEISPSPAVLLKGMEGSRLGVWVAHGEGRLFLPDGAPAINPELAPVRFVDPKGVPTDTYPFNPNGSPGGVTALCSADGRHLALMPHPERTTNQLWQFPWVPDSWRELEASPWLRLFQNAYDFCVSAR